MDVAKPTTWEILLERCRQQRLLAGSLHYDRRAGAQNPQLHFRRLELYSSAFDSLCAEWLKGFDGD